MIIGGAKNAEKIINEEAKKKLEFLNDMAKEMETLFAGRGVKNNQIETIIQIFANRHTQRIDNMRMDDEIRALNDYEYKQQPLQPTGGVARAPQGPTQAA